MIHVVFSSDLTAAVRRFGSIRRRNQPEPVAFAFKRGWRAGCDNSSTITFFRPNSRSFLDQNFHPHDVGMKKGNARGRGFGGQLGESGQKFAVLPIFIAQLVIFDLEAPHGGSLAWDSIDSLDDAVRGVERRRFGMKVASHVADQWQGVIEVRPIDLLTSV
jgi:hypothetical protein